MGLEIGRGCPWFEYCTEAMERGLYLFDLLEEES